MSKLISNSPLVVRRCSLRTGTLLRLLLQVLLSNAVQLIFEELLEHLVLVILRCHLIIHSFDGFVRRFGLRAGHLLRVLLLLRLLLRFSLD